MNFDQMDLSLRIKRSEKMIFSSVGPFISMLKEKKIRRTTQTRNR